MRLGRRHRRHGPGATLVALVLAGIVAQPAIAWTLLRNNYPNSPVSCTNVSPYWCVKWPKLSNGLSSTTYVYLDPSLDIKLSGETLNFKQEARDAFARWNGAAARNPFLKESSTIEGSSGRLSYGCATEIARTNNVPSQYWAWTATYTPYDWSGGGSKTTLVCFYLEFGYAHTFNSHGNLSGNDGDADFIMTHELGHAEGLGHTGYAAIMYPAWPNSVYMGVTPTSNDVAGLVAAYGAP